MADPAKATHPTVASTAVAVLENLVSTATAATSATPNTQRGFRTSHPFITDSFPRFLLKMGSFGYLGAASHSSVATSSTPAAAATVTSSANAAADAVASAAASAAASVSKNVTDALSNPGTFDTGMRSMGSIFNYGTSKWALLCLFTVDPSHNLLLFFFSDRRSGFMRIDCFLDAPHSSFSSSTAP